MHDEWEGEDLLVKYGLEEWAGVYWSAIEVDTYIHANIQVNGHSFLEEFERRVIAKYKEEQDDTN